MSPDLNHAQLDVAARVAATTWVAHELNGQVPDAVHVAVNRMTNDPADRVEILSRARMLVAKSTRRNETRAGASATVKAQADAESVARQEELASRRRALIETRGLKAPTPEGIAQAEALERQRLADIRERLEMRLCLVKLHAILLQRKGHLEAEDQEIQRWIEAEEREEQRLLEEREQELRALREAEELAERQRIEAEERERQERWLDRPAPAPEPQLYGVSHEGAEHLVAAWMRHLGLLDAAATRAVADGGIDVESAGYVAQVKNYAGSVAVVDVRALFGVAAAEGKKALLFTSGSMTIEGTLFANKVGMALLHYDAMKGTLVGLNDLGRACVEWGIPEAFEAAALTVEGDGA